MFFKILFNVSPQMFYAVFFSIIILFTKKSKITYSQFLYECHSLKFVLTVDLKYKKKLKIFFITNNNY